MSEPSIPEVGSRRYFRRMLKRDLHREIAKLSAALGSKRDDPGALASWTRGMLACHAADLFAQLKAFPRQTTEEKDLGK